MSDKSFGDHTNRNIVKNPLLSSAVTGLSIEDLTHNAMLLPAAPTQEPSTRQDKHAGDSIRSLGDANKITNLQTGDANFNTTLSDINLENHNVHQTSQYGNYTESKPPHKSDDFDVNEYFARLQGTRYVSAPLNSCLQDNFQPDENLEEINLNDEKEKDISDITQNSITSDIAQNFSQLPTVLPQVASAVLSSFSNMLNLKSRELTQNDGTHGYNAPVPSQPANVSVPLTVPETHQAIAPPPMKEPPTTGIPSYRIPTKKKVYAQVPGLSYDNRYTITTAPTASTNPVLYFTPDANKTMYQPETLSSVHQSALEIKEKSACWDKVDHDISLSSIEPCGISNFNQPQRKVQQKDCFQQMNVGRTPINPIHNQEIPVIPPPPMFCNIPQRDNQTFVEKTILPPSVARRIAAKQPVIKEHTVSAIKMPDIFVPTVPDVNAESEQDNMFLQQRDQNIYNATPLSVTEIPIAGDNILKEKPYNYESNAPVQSISCKEELQSVTDIDTLINPLNQNQSDSNLKQDKFKNISNIPTQQTSSHHILADEPQKVTTVPPKSIETVNYRMTKRKPQYYSGPIEGVGNISNNVIPIINPIGISAFQGSLFTPAPAPHDINISSTPMIDPHSYNIQHEQVLNCDPVPIIDSVEKAAFRGSIFTPNLGVEAVDTSPASYMSTEPPAPTDINITSAPMIDSYNIQQKQILNYDTAFDLSRPQTNKYELTNEPKGFGIIGSLKSKLSSIDINKIQNTVTTFFDPDYNNKKDESKINPEYATQSHISQYLCNDSNLDIFVPSFKQTENAVIAPNNQSYTNVGSLDHRSLHQNFILPPYQDENCQTAIYYQSLCVNPPYPNEEFTVGVNESNRNVSNTNKSSQDVCQINKNYNIQKINKNNESDVKIIETECKLYESTNSLHFFDQTNFHSEQIRENKNVAQDFSKVLYNPDTKESHNIIVGKVQSSETVETKGIKRESKDAVTNKTDPWSSNLINTQQESYITDSEQKINLDGAYAKVGSHPSANSFSNDQSDSNSIVDKHLDFAIKSVDDFQLPYSENEQIQSSSLPFGIQHNLNPVGFQSKDIEKIASQNILSHPLSSYFKKPSEDVTESVFQGISLSRPKSVYENDALDANLKITNDFLHGDSEEMYIIEPDSSVEYIENQVSELSICETCREVNKPELAEKEVEDLTTQLIENITAPIQLSNPLGVADGLSPLPILASQFLESPIPEDIMENIKPVIDLLDENAPEPTYGWSTENIYLSTEALKDHTYNIKTDPNAIGFFQNKSLSFEDIPKNVNDEIKAGFENAENNHSSLPRHFAIPIAPPEEDTKSDEGGIDVNSIELDAKNDFPIYTNVTNEPSETDDNKVEIRERKSSVEERIEEADSFTNRVEKFKQMESSTDSTENIFNVQKEIMPIPLPTSTSPALTIASYFDTGNYAAETHYKNSLTSSTTISAFNTGFYGPPSIPPGFEEEYKRKMSGTIITHTLMPNIVFIPETTTQTSVTTAITLCKSTDNKTVLVCTAQNIEHRKEKFPSEAERLPAFANMIKSHNEFVASENKSSIILRESQNSKEEEKETKSLPEPMNFFSNQNPTAASTEHSDAYNSFNRLSSYFTTPSSDHSKSFFELSQSQNHYRHKDEEKSDYLQNTVTQFFHKHNPPKSDKNIPNKYFPNMNLINDLTSTNYYNPKNVVKTVNYFTVEYDKCSKDNIGEPGTHLKDTHSVNKNNFCDYNKGDLDMVGYAELTIKNCKHCCDLTTGSIVDMNTKDCNIKKHMDETINSKNRDEPGGLNKKEEKITSIKVKILEQSMQEERNEDLLLMDENHTPSECTLLKHHWFYKCPTDSEDKYIWRGFSMADSAALENAFQNPKLNEHTYVPTDGGRYDVNVVGRLRVAVYWPEKPTNVMRCSWFYKGTTDGRYVPYAEDIAEILEEEYCHGMRTGEWHRRLVLPNRVVVVMHGPSVMVHFQQADINDLASSILTFGKHVYRNPPNIKVSEEQPQQIDHLIFLVHGAGEYRNHKKNTNAVNTWKVRRGCEESELEESEPSTIDHLVLLCHGVGSACDLRMRPVDKVVNDFRYISLQLIQSHYRSSYESGVVGRVEVLPISWHSKLHSGETGVDRRLAAITLESIPRLRSFTNDTILDVLFYTSPVYCQTIVDTVCSEMNRIYELFKSRNPNFKGGVSLGGHSLGSVILYDLLCHQLPVQEGIGLVEKRYVSGAAGTGQPMIKYPSLQFAPDAMYALGSPIAIFESIRGVDILGQEFHLPTCKNFFNIFHPYDPIAYRIEPMINPILRDVKPLLIPHHKGRKRMHLELKDTMARVGADLKQRLMEVIKATWSNVWKSTPPPTDQQLEKVVEEELEKEQMADEGTLKEDKSCDVKQALPEMLGQLNGGKRVDHVLQEAPFEMINEYIFAMRSHLCYWESEDTMLLILREIYDSIGIQPDSCIPAQNLTVHRTRTVSEDNATLSAFPDSASTSRTPS